MNMDSPSGKNKKYLLPPAPQDQTYVSGWGAAPPRPQRPPLLVLAGQGPPSPSPLLLSPCRPPVPAFPLGPQAGTGGQLGRLLVAAIDEDELRYQFVKKKGYVRLHTSLGDLNLELHCDLVRGCPPGSPVRPRGGQAHTCSGRGPAAGPGNPCPRRGRGVTRRGPWPVSDAENL